MISPGLHIRQGVALDLSLAVIVSVWLHIIGLLVWRYVSPSPAILDQPPRFIEVEIDISQPIQSLEIEPETAAEENRTVEKTAGLSEAKPPTWLEEETISLESKSPLYLSYLHEVKNRIKNSWVLKAGNEILGRDGQLLIVFTLANNGRLLRVELDTSSGQAILDRAALTAVRQAVPYPAFPDHIKLKRLNIRAVFDYRFKYIGVR
ncbi:MAG: TonB family protein [Candidatus Adiutricales bacterium]